MSYNRVFQLSIDIRNVVKDKFEDDGVTRYWHFFPE